MILLSKFDFALLTNSIIYSTVGIVILVISFVIVEKLTPKHSLWKEIVESKNNALAIVAAAFILAVAIIVASAIH
jgi:putative membrane protein